MGYKSIGFNSLLRLDTHLVWTEMSVRKGRLSLFI